MIGALQETPLERERERDTDPAPSPFDDLEVDNDEPLICSACEHRLTTGLAGPVLPATHELFVSFNRQSPGDGFFRDLCDVHAAEFCTLARQCQGFASLELGPDGCVTLAQGEPVAEIKRDGDEAVILFCKLCYGCAGHLLDECEP